MATCRSILVALAICAVAPTSWAAPRVERLAIDGQSSGTPFVRHWGDFGAEQAPVTLDPEYGRQLDKLKRGISSFQYLRFHNIFSEELVKVARKPNGQLDFDDLDRVFGKAGDVYANLLARKLKPYVELGFMPRALAKSPTAVHAFTFQPIMSEPKDFAEWGTLVEQFTRYLVKRFGADEVRTWPFEIWNEYNLDFYAGPNRKAKVYTGARFRAKERSYFALYKASALAIKAVDPKIDIVGPGTAAVYGLKKFIDWTVENGAPLPDRISTHVYGNETPERVLGLGNGKSDGGATWVKGKGQASTTPAAEQYRLASLAMQKARKDVLASKAPWLADRIEFTEMNRSYNKDPQGHDPESTDRASHGAWLVDTYKRSIGAVARIVHWVGTDYRFEELPWERQKDLADRHGGFGVMDRNGVWKAGGNVMRALSKLPDGTRLTDSEHTIVTRGADGRIGFVAYNPSSEDALHLHADLANLEPGSVLRTWRVDDDHANAQGTWEGMGSPKNASVAQVRQMNRAASLRSRTRVIRPQMRITVPKNGVLVGVIEPRSK
jgi:xylan 1,4-beta-xylosidase